MKASFESLIQSETPLLIDFHAEWCGPCKSQSPILKELASEMADKVKIIKIDVDKNPEIAARYHIQGVPTIMLFKNSVVKFRHSGLLSKHQIVKIISQNS